MYDTILVPTDGSDHAGRAADHALYLADAFDATVHVITAVDVQAEAGPFGAGGVDEAFVDRHMEQGQALIDDIESKTDADARVETAVIEGRPTDVILDYADDNEVDLIAMGTHGRTGIRRYAWGSVTERVVRRAEIPVLSVQATDRSELGDGYDDILLPTDGSEFATVAVDHGLALAGIAGARVHALNVIDVGDMATSPSVTPPTEVLTGLTSEGERATEEIADRARDEGFEAMTAVREGYPAKDILAYVEDNDIDLIAMGTQGRTGLNRFLLGSTAERVLRHAEVPVLAIGSHSDAE